MRLIIVVRLLTFLRLQCIGWSLSFPVQERPKASQARDRDSGMLGYFLACLAPRMLIAALHLFSTLVRCVQCRH